MSTVVVVELEYDGTPLYADDGTRWFRITKGHPGSPPVVRGRDVVIPHAAGAVPKSRRNAYLDIELEGKQTAPEGVSLDDARAAYTQGVRALRALFAGDTAPRQLLARLADGSTATIEARVIPPLLEDEHEREQALVSDFNVALRSVDPAWVIDDEGS